jgi:hypothetical protein
MNVTEISSSIVILGLTDRSAIGTGKGEDTARDLCVHFTL